MVRIGLVTDTHYAEAPSFGNRHYRDSLPKMREAVEMFGRGKVDCIVHLGDLVDTGPKGSKGKEADYAAMMAAVLRSAGLPVYFVLGNHCLNDLTKGQMLSICGQKKSFFSFDLRDTHVVVLDACFRSDSYDYEPGKFNYVESRIPTAQLDWLEADLKKTGKRTIVFCHQRLDNPRDKRMGVMFRATVREALARSGKVDAVFMGHAHENDLQVIDGIHYVGLQALVEGAGVASGAYSILEVAPDGKIKLEGYRQHRKHPLAQAA